MNYMERYYAEGPIREQIMYDRERFRQSVEENKKAVYESIEVYQDGSVVTTTQNLWIDSRPKEISNMRFPELFIAARSSNLNEKVFVLTCKVAGIELIVYLNPERVGSGTYILGKLAAVGIDIWAPSTKVKEYARRLITMLVQNGKDSIIPDELGWMKTENGEFTFVEEGRMTWQMIKELI